jgi:hypothetical protein
MYVGHRHSCLCLPPLDEKSAQAGVPVPHKLALTQTVKTHKVARNSNPRRPSPQSGRHRGSPGA